MAGDQHSGSVGIRAGNDGVDVARSVRYRLITHLVQAAGKILRALSLVVGGGGNLHNFQLLLQDVFRILLQKGRRLDHFWVLHQFFNIVHV